MTHFEIIAEILGLCRRPQEKTGLLYEMNLSWHRLSAYLDLMRSLGLLNVQNSRTRYLTTPKGRKFLEKLKEMVVIITCMRGKSDDVKT